VVGLDFAVQEKTREDKLLSAQTLRILGILMLVAAAVIAVLNLKRVANLGMLWLNAPLLVIGIALVVAARRRT
jgi:hypothetical protein